MKRVASLLFVATLFACDATGGSSTGAPSTSLPPAGPTSSSIATPTTTTTTTTPTTATTTTPTTATPDTTITSPPSGDPGNVGEPVPMLLDDATCDVSWVVPVTRAGHVTIARDRDLFDVDVATGDVTCIARLDRVPARLDWNPVGDRLLIDGEFILSADGQTTSGLASATTGISWSQPQGTALIAPSPDGDALIHVSVEDPSVVMDVGALVTTWAAAYHPSGLAIISAGVDEQGRRGLYIADNRGEGLQRLVILDDATTKISEVAVAADGSSVTFVHDHTGGTIDEGVLGHVHRVGLPELWIEDLAALPAIVPTQLVISNQLDGAAAWNEPESPTDQRPTVWRTDGTSQPVELDSPDSDTRVVGFVSEGATVVLAMPDDAPGGGEVWLNPVDGDPLLIAHRASAATTRTLRIDTWLDPPLDIELQALG